MNIDTCSLSFNSLQFYDFSSSCAHNSPHWYCPSCKYFNRALRQWFAFALFTPHQVVLSRVGAGGDGCDLGAFERARTALFDPTTPNKYARLIVSEHTDMVTALPVRWFDAARFCVFDRALFCCYPSCMHDWTVGSCHCGHSMSLGLLSSCLSLWHAYRHQAEELAMHLPNMRNLGGGGGGGGGGDGREAQAQLRAFIAQMEREQGQQQHQVCL